jgi:predicted P-loop ATPase
MSKQDKKELRQQIACDWLEQNYLQYDNLRYDMVTDRLQVRSALSIEDGSAYSLEFRGKEIWRNLTDKDINTMVCQCVQETGANISITEIWTALKSDLITSVHPIRTWLNHLPEYTPEQTDWIDFVAQQVHVVGDEQANKYWRHCFRKWFVAMVASWMNDEVVNHTVLVLVGRQGIFKTTWLDHLIPPELRAYSSKLPLSGQISKDDRLRLCENAMLNIDELDAICGREMNIVKSLLTSTDVNERAAYGRLKERRARLASFCASTNNREFLTDITGNRRWLPFEVESIQNPFYTTLPYKYLFAQAKYLVEQGWFAYWFDMEEIEELEKHNEEFRTQDNEEQLLPILFDIPAEGKGEFMTTAEISERLVTFGGIKKPMNTRQLGMLMTKKGFEKKQVYLSGSTVRGWMVYKRDTDEITLAKKIDNNYASCQPSDIY